MKLESLLNGTQISLEGLNVKPVFQLKHEDRKTLLLNQTGDTEQNQLQNSATKDKYSNTCA